MYQQVANTNRNHVPILFLMILLAFCILSCLNFFHLMQIFVFERWLNSWWISDMDDFYIYLSRPLIARIVLTNIFCRVSLPCTLGSAISIVLILRWLNFFMDCFMLSIIRPGYFSYLPYKTMSIGISRMSSESDSSSKLFLVVSYVETTLNSINPYDPPLLRFLPIW